MNIAAVVATLAGMTEEQVESIVLAINATREANTALAAIEPPKKKRGRKPGTKMKKAAPPAKKVVAKKGRKAKVKLPDTFGDED